MDEIELEGPTYDDALEKALDKLDADAEEVDVEVLSEGPPVRLRVSLRASLEDQAQDWLLDVLDAMEIAASVGLYDEDENLVFHIETDDDAGMIIGRKGSTLDALQYLLNVAYGQQLGRRLVVDVQDYRRRHQEKLLETAQHAAERVRSSGRPVRLAPMSAADRRVVHHELANHVDLETGSQGEEPHRFIVVYPRRNGAGRTVYRGE